MEKENCGDLFALVELSKNKKNNFTVEQLLDENLKNLNGESNIEVRTRMLEVVDEIIINNPQKRIAIISHGAAIKFLLQKWCKYEYNKDGFFFKGNYICSQRLEAPSILRLVFKKNQLESINKI